MTPEHRDRLREAARRRANCHGCGASGLREVDGSEIGGMPGIPYRYCNGCGWSQAKTRRLRRPKL